MESVVKNPISATPMKDPSLSRTKSQEISKSCENSNPNVSFPSPNPKPSKSSPVIKSAKSLKSASKNPNPNPNPVKYNSPRNKLRERKFIVAKKSKKKEEDGGGSKVGCKCGEKVGGKCLCVAYENLRASQEEFFKTRNGGVLQNVESSLKESEVEEMEKCLMIHDLSLEEKINEEAQSSGLGDPEFCELGEPEGFNQMVSSTVKRRRDKLMEEARKSMPESGSGIVKHLVKAFEQLKTIPNSDEEEEEKEGEKEGIRNKSIKWALPGVQPCTFTKMEESSTLFSPPESLLTAENLGLDSRASISSSWDSSSQGSASSQTSNGGRRSRRNSSESYSTIGGSRWKKKQLKITSQKPFKLRTEQRGRVKEEEFMKKVQEMMMEEEKLRIPIAQGLPWTTDEPECLVKPTIKENTRPLDLKLHTDTRAVERAEFDHQIAEKLSLIEQYKMERERQQKLAEEEEVRRLRKELVPKAQPMPYFDRPFIPKRSSKHPTIPKEPKFHIPEHKKIKCLSWNDISPYTYHQ